MKIVQVYVTSFSVPPDIESYRIHRMHSHCAPGLAEAGLELSDFHGRVLETDSADLLSLLSAVQRRWRPQTLVVQVYDVGHLCGRLKAMTAGVWRTPAIVIDGEKHVGLSTASGALRDLGVATGSREQSADHSDETHE